MLQKGPLLPNTSTHVPFKCTMYHLLYIVDSLEFVVSYFLVI